MSFPNTNNTQISSQFDTQDRFTGATGTNFNAPSGTHAQQHNLHTLETPLNEVPNLNASGGTHNLKQGAQKLQHDMESTHPHTQQHGANPTSDQFPQEQPFGHSSAHNTHGSTMHSGLGTDEPYSTTSIGGTGNNINQGSGHPTSVLPGTGMSIGGQHHTSNTHTSSHLPNLPVPGSVVDHSRDNRDRVDQSKSAQGDVDNDRLGRKRDEFEGSTGHHTTGMGTHGTTGFNSSTHGSTGTHGTSGMNTSSHGQTHKGPLEAMGVTGATGRDTSTTNTGSHGTGTGLGSSDHHRTTGGIASTEGRKDGDILGHDTKATNAGHAIHNPTSKATDHTKPSMGDKIAGMAEKVQGKITGNPALVEKGEQRGQGLGPKN